MLFQHFRSIKDGYERSKEEAQQRLQHDQKEAEDNWSRAQSHGNAQVGQVRQICDTTLGTVSSSPWNDQISGGAPPTLLLGVSDNPAQAMEQCRSIAAQAQQEVMALLQSKKEPSEIRKNAGCLALVGALVCCSIFYILAQGAASSGNAGSIVFPGLLLAVGAGIGIYAAMVNGPRSRLRNALATLNNAVYSAESLLEQQLKGPRELYQSQLNQAQARYTESLRHIEQAWSEQLASIRPAFIEFDRQVQTNFMGMPWNDPQWAQWTPSPSITPTTRLGTLTAHRDLPIVPGLVACPGRENILFKAAGVGKEQAIVAIQAVMVRLLATQPPGKVRFTLIDPVGLGQNVSTFMQLSDYDEEIVGSKAWSESRHIDKELADLSEHMSYVIQKYLRGQYKAIEEYNQQAGEVAEPYRILVVIGFPVKFSAEAAGRLVEISTNGPKCGVSTLVLLDTEQPSPYSFNMSDLEQVSLVFSWDGQHFNWQNADFEECQLLLDTPPSLELLNKLLQEVGQQAKIASEE